MIEISFLDFLRDLVNPHLDFLARAVGISLLAAIVCGVIGCYVSCCAAWPLLAMPSPTRYFLA